ncbi:MAG: thioredoxin domain-containing protein [Candidatus Kuenenbacteria bacterium]
MQKQSIFLFIFIVLGLIIISAFVISIIKEKPIKENLNETSFLSEPIIFANDPVLGNITTQIAIIEFGDFKCSACQKVEITLKEILKKYPNQVKLIWKGIPGHSESQNALLASYCAQEQGQFWKYHDLLFSNQDKLDQQNIYFELAQNINLDLKKFDYCLNNQTFLDLIQENMTQAQKLRIDSTPYFFIGKKNFSGALSFEKFQMIIEEQIKNMKTFDN